MHQRGFNYVFHNLCVSFNSYAHSEDHAFKLNWHRSKNALGPFSPSWAEWPKRILRTHCNCVSTPSFVISLIIIYSLHIYTHYMFLNTKMATYTQGVNPQFRFRVKRNLPLLCELLFSYPIASSMLQDQGALTFTRSWEPDRDLNQNVLLPFRS